MPPTNQSKMFSSYYSVCKENKFIIRYVLSIYLIWSKNKNKNKTLVFKQHFLSTVLLIPSHTLKY